MTSVNWEAKVASVFWRKSNRKLWDALFSVSGFTDELQEQNHEDILLPLRQIYTPI